MFHSIYLIFTQSRGVTLPPSFMVSGLGKVEILKKIMKHRDSLDLLSSLEESEELSMHSIKDVMVFVQTVMYSGRKDEPYVDTRARLYKAMLVLCYEIIAIIASRP